jgi:hypothetical protein
VDYRPRDAGGSDLDWIRRLAAGGCRQFLLGAEGASDSQGFLVAGDHVSLFGDGPLVGPNEDGYGPRFPSLLGLYKAPEGPWRTGVVCRVPDWRFATPAELAATHAGALVSEGIDEAIVAGHGGASVLLLVRCHAWRRWNAEDPPLSEASRLLLEV